MYAGATMKVSHSPGWVSSFLRASSLLAQVMRILDLTPYLATEES